jgi:hypothetical protein
MKELWNRTFELSRRNIVLWLPCSIAGILMLGLGKLERAEIRWLVRFFSTKHSVLGGEVSSMDLALAQHRAMMVLYPSSLLKYVLEVCFFVVALAATKNLVHMLLNEQTPDLIGAMRRDLPRSREVLLLSVKYIAVLGLFGGILIVIGSSPLTSDRIHELVLSKPFIYVFGLVGNGCLAWLLVPAAVRLLQPQGTPAISTEGRRLGTAFAVASSACALALEYVVTKAESGLIFGKPWEIDAIAVVNTVIINAPQVLLFIALTLLALQSTGEQKSLVPESENVW